MKNYAEAGKRKGLKSLFYKIFTIFFYTVAYIGKCLFYFEFIACGLGRVRKILVKFLSLTGEEWASFFCIITNGNHKIEVYIFVSVDMIGAMLGDIYSIFPHRFNSFWVKSMRFYAGAVDIGFRSGKVA